MTQFLVRHSIFLCALAPSLYACANPSNGSDVPAVRMDFTRATGFFDAPFPSEELRRPDGSLDATRMAQYPNPDQVGILVQAMALLTHDAHGFAVSGASYFSFTEDLGAVQLPDVAGSTRPDSPIFLVDLESKVRYPVLLRYVHDGGPYGAANMLSLLPVQGIPLRPGKSYAAVIRSTLLDDQGRAITPAPAVAQLASGMRPDGLTDNALSAYQNALAALAQVGIASSDIAGLGVFTTDSPAAAMAAFRDDILSRPLPKPVSPLVLGDMFKDYCVFTSTIDLPDYQQGDPPYSQTGGGWALGPDGQPVAPHLERANLVVTIPRSPMPAAGFPTVVFIRTGAGGDRPLVDRGVQAMTGGPPITPGSGPAQEFAQIGFAGVQVDGPLGGLRNTTDGNEDYLIFNVFNPTALRDNIRESALELLLIAHIVPTLSIASGGCSNAPATARLDATRMALMGHSMGATIAPLALAWEPTYRAAILSGAGGSYIENILWKRKPVEIRPIAETLLKYPVDSTLIDSDPALTLAQWAAEPSDPPAYAHLIVREPLAGSAPRHVLMEQGIVDNYILPNIANAISVSAGLDLAGPALDQDKPELAMQTPVLDLLPLVGHGQIGVPAAGNVTSGGAKVTAVVAQHPEDGIEDGHEVVFQTEPPKHQYRCFLHSLAAGQTPVVPTDGAADAPCP